MPYTYTYSYSNAWDSWAKSVKLFEDIGSFTFSFDFSSAGIICGIAEDGISESHNNIKHGIYYNSGEVKIFESGVLIDPEPQTISFGSSYTVKISVLYDRVEYYFSDILVYTSMIDWFSSYENFRLYACAYQYNDKIYDPSFEDNTEDGQLNIEIPALECFGTDDLYDICDPELPPLKCEILTEDTFQLNIELPGFYSYLADQDYILSDSILPPLESSTALIIPFVCNCEGTMPSYYSSGIISDDIEIKSELPQFVSLNIDNFIDSKLYALDCNITCNTDIGLPYIRFFIGTPLVKILGSSAVSIFAKYENYSMFMNAESTGSYITGEIFDIERYADCRIVSGSSMVSSLGLGICGEISSSTLSGNGIVSELGIELSGKLICSGSISDKISVAIDGTIGSNAMTSSLSGSIDVSIGGNISCHNLGVSIIGSIPIQQAGAINSLSLFSFIEASFEVCVHGMLYSSRNIAASILGEIINEKSMLIRIHQSGLSIGSKLPELNGKISIAKTASQPTEMIMRYPNKKVIA